MSGTVYFHGHIQNKEIKIVRHGDIFDGKTLQSLYVSFYPYGGDSLTYDRMFNSGYSTSTILDYFLRNSGLSRNFFTSEFEKEFKTTLVRALEDFKKEVDNDFSLDGWIGRLIIKPIENIFDWLKK
jgi:hypothetical protein